MIGMAIFLQAAAILCFTMWLSEKRPETKEKPEAADIQLGQVYEFLIPGRNGEPSTIAYRKVIDRKGGYVKYRMGTTLDFDSIVDHVQPDELFLSNSRLLSPKKNPFMETTP